MRTLIQLTRQSEAEFQEPQVENGLIIEIGGEGEAHREYHRLLMSKLKGPEWTNFQERREGKGRGGGHTDRYTHQLAACKREQCRSHPRSEEW